MQSVNRKSRTLFVRLTTPRSSGTGGNRSNARIFTLHFAHKRANLLLYIIYEKNALVKTAKPQSFELSKKKILGKITYDFVKIFSKIKKSSLTFCFCRVIINTVAIRKRKRWNFSAFFPSHFQIAGGFEKKKWYFRNCFSSSSFLCFA